MTMHKTCNILSAGCDCNLTNSTKRKKPSKTKALIQLTYIAVLFLKKNLVDTDLPSVTLNGLPFT